MTKPKPDQKQEIIEQLGKLFKPVKEGIQHKLSYTMKRWELELVADFVIADRKRVCGPLVKFKQQLKSLEETKSYKYVIDVQDVIDQTLKLAGLE